MRPLTLLQSGLFAGLVLAVAAAAGSRAVPFDLPDHTDWMDGRLAKAFEAHYDDSFPAKTFGTNLWAAIDYLLFHEGRPGVVVGDQGWLYTGEEFQTYPGADTTVATHLSLIPWVRDELARQGTRLVVALVPAKARIYPEYLAGHRPAAVHEALYTRALGALRESGIVAPDLARALEDCKRVAPAFLRTDTHWTPTGARCAAQAVQAATPARYVARGRKGSYRTQVAAAQPYRGDLARYLPLDPYFRRLLPPPEPLAVPRTELAAASAGAAGLLGDASAPSIVLIGTSYSADERWNLGGALQEAFEQDVVNYAMKGKGPFEPMLDYLLNSRDLPSPPRLVIWELPERYLPMAQDLRVVRHAPCPAPARGAAASVHGIL